MSFFFFQAEDGIRDLVRSRGLGDVYKRQQQTPDRLAEGRPAFAPGRAPLPRVSASVRAPPGLSLIHI